MRTRGSLQHGYSVMVSCKEVESFRDRWPCSELPDVAVTFYFDSRGDLVDIRPDNIDGPDALALSQDAQAHALRSTDGSKEGR